MMMPKLFRQLKPHLFGIVVAIAMLGVSALPRAQQNPPAPASQSEQDVVGALRTLETSTQMLESGLRRWNADFQKQIADMKEDAAKRDKEWHEYVAPLLGLPAPTASAR